MGYRWRRQLRWAAGMIAAGAIAAAAVPAFAAAADDQAATVKSIDLEAAKLYIDGKQSSIAAATAGGTAYISLDSLPAIGDVKLSNQDDTYTVSSNTQEISFTLGKKELKVNGAAQSERVAALKSGNQVYVPIAWVDEAAGIKFVNDRFTSSVYIFRKQGNSDSPAQWVPAESEQADSVNSSTVIVSGAPPTFLGLLLEGDQLTIQATGEVQPNVFRLKEPDRIVIDLPNTTLERAADGSASGSFPVDANHSYISNIRYSLFAFEPATVRIVVDLKRPIWHHVVPQESGAAGAVIRFMDVEPIEVIIDAGHGDTDPGAISKSGKFEKDLTLAIALKVADRLKNEPLIKPVLIRDDDTYTSPAERAAEANKLGVDLYVSIHANSSDQSSVKGTETFYWRDDSLKFAETVHKELLAAIGSSDRSVKRDRFLVIRETTMPAVLLELGFISNAEDEAKLYNDQMQNRIADAIVKAIKKYYQIS